MFDAPFVPGMAFRRRVGYDAAEFLLAAIGLGAAVGFPALLIAVVV